MTWMGAGPMRRVVGRYQTDMTHLRTIFMLVGISVGSGGEMKWVSNWVIYFRQLGGAILRLLGSKDGSRVFD